MDLFTRYNAQNVSWEIDVGFFFDNTFWPEMFKCNILNKTYNYTLYEFTMISFNKISTVNDTTDQYKDL